MSNQFSVKVSCDTGGNPHFHELVVQAGAGGVFGATPPPKVRLQYICPTTSERRLATFAPPPKMPRPYSIVRVTDVR